MKNTLLETQKTMALLYVAIAENIVGDYELILTNSNCKLLFSYMNEYDHSLEFEIGLLGENNETYMVFVDNDLVFASKDIEDIVDFIDKQIEEMPEENKLTTASESLLSIKNGKFYLDGLPVENVKYAFSPKRFSTKIEIPEDELS